MTKIKYRMFDKKKNNKGHVVARIKMYWCTTLKRWVSIPED